MSRFKKTLLIIGITLVLWPLIGCLIVMLQTQAILTNPNATIPQVTSLYNELFYCVAAELPCAFTSFVCMQFLGEIL